MSNLKVKKRIIPTSVNESASNLPLPEPKPLAYYHSYLSSLEDNDSNILEHLQKKAKEVGYRDEYGPLRKKKKKIKKSTTKKTKSKYLIYEKQTKKRKLDKQNLDEQVNKTMKQTVKKDKTIKKNKTIKQIQHKNGIDDYVMDYVKKIKKNKSTLYNYLLTNYNNNKVYNVLTKRFKKG